MKEEEIIASLSHSYFNHILKDVQPFLEYFDTSLIKSQFKKFQSQKYSNLQDGTYQSELIERLFFMACLNSVDISLPFNYNTTEDNTTVDKVNIRTSSKGRGYNKVKKSDWLLDIKPFGSKSKQGVVSKSLIFDNMDVLAFLTTTSILSKSKQGVVSKSLIFDNMDVVVKKAKTSKFDEITIRDFCVGINLNKILNEAPFFVHTIGCFQFKNQFHIVTQFIDGINLKAFLQNKKSTFVEFLNIFFQILLGLEIAQNKLNFAHYDLHTDNVILVPCKETIEVTLYGSYFSQLWC